MIMAIIHVFLVLCLSVLGIPELQRCADSECKVAISEAETKITYAADTEGKVSFKKGDKAIVYGKTKGTYWNVEVNGKRGVAHHGFLKEKRVIHKDLKYEVPIEIPDEIVEKSDSSESLKKEPLIESSYDVFEGTTIYVNSSDDAVTEPMSTLASEMTSVPLSPSKAFDPENERKQSDLNSSPMHTQVKKESFKVSHTKLQSDDISTFDEKEYPSSENELESSKENPDHLYQRFDTRTSDRRNSYRNKIVEDKEENEKEDWNLINDDSEPVSEKDNGDSIDNENESEERETLENENKGDMSEEIMSEEMYKSVDEDIDTPENNKEQNENDLELVKMKSEDDLKTVVTDEIKNNGEKSFGSSEDESPPLQEELKSGISDQGEEENDKYPNVTEEKEVLHDDSNVESTGSSNFDFLLSHGSQEENSSSTAAPSIEEGSNKNTEEGLTPANILIDTPSTDLPSVSELQNIQETTNSPEEVKKEKNIIFEEGKSETQAEISGAQEVGESEAEQIKSKMESNLNKITFTQSSLESNYDETLSGGLFGDVHTEMSSGEPSFCTESVDDKCHENVFGYSSMSNLGNMKMRNANDESAGEHGRPGISHEERDNDKMPPGDVDEHSEVQGSCESEQSGCVLSDELAEEFSSSIDVDRGWFAAYFQVPNLALLSQILNTDERNRSFGTFVYLVVTAVSVVVFTLGYYYTEKQRRDSTFIAKISSLEKALMVACQEKIVLNDELETTKDKLSYVNSESVNSDENSSFLQVELEKAKNARFELETQVATLEKELEAATEAGLELNRMMTELLSAQHGSDTLLQSVEHLQHQLDSQQNTISSMNARLTAKNVENQKLQSQLNAASTRVQNLEEKLAKVSETLGVVQKEKLTIEHDFTVKNQSIEKQLMEALESKSADSERLRREVDDLQDKLDETRGALAAREGEVAALRESLAQAECLSSGGESSVSLDELLNVGNLRAQIDSLKKDRHDLMEKLRGEEDARKLLEDHVKIVSEEISTLRTKYEEADHGKVEAQTRLEVLSSYFREKETQLQKELGLQEAMCIQKEGDALSTNEQIRTFKEEVESYKAQNEILKREIIDQERSMKSQIATLEKKAHENWVAARQAERRLEESKQEASQLRNRLTLSGRRIAGTMPGPEMGKSPDRELEYNGEMSSSPAHLSESQELPSSPMHYGLPGSPPLLPPSGQLPPVPFSSMPLFLPPGAPPLPFPLPPPPPGNIFPDDLRPPPLGRMSSPPPETLSSFSPFDNSPPISPHGRPYRSPIHYDDSSSSRYPQSLQSGSSFAYSSYYPSNKWDDSPRSSFRPLHRDSPHEPKGSTMSSGHSSESLDKGSRHSGRV